MANSIVVGIPSDTDTVSAEAIEGQAKVDARPDTNHKQFKVTNNTAAHGHYVDRQGVPVEIVQNMGQPVTALVGPRKVPIELGRAIDMGEIANMEDIRSGKEEMPEVQPEVQLAASTLTDGVDATDAGSRDQLAAAADAVVDLADAALTPEARAELEGQGISPENMVETAMDSVDVAETAEDLDEVMGSMVQMIGQANTEKYAAFISATGAATAASAQREVGVTDEQMKAFEGSSEANSVACFKAAVAAARGNPSPMRELVRGIASTKPVLSAGDSTWTKANGGNV